MSGGGFRNFFFVLHYCAKMARKPDSFSKYGFDDIIEARSVDYSMNPWGEHGLDCDFELLNRLIAKALETGVKQESGRFAKAFDSWAAVELRRAGFPADSVWPRQSMPRVLTNELVVLLEKLTPMVRAEELRKWLEMNSNSSAVAPAEARVLGGVYRKQADVLIADWSAGVEVMISTKSMLGSYGKNLRNRFEESFGDAINLRQRFPLGSFGFLFVVDKDVPSSDFVFLISMLEKLVDSAGYDACSLVVVDLETKALDENRTHQVPTHLQPSQFFETIVQRVIDRTPASRHPLVRRFRGLDVDETEES